MTVARGLGAVGREARGHVQEATFEMAVPLWTRNYRPSSVCAHSVLRSLGWPVTLQVESRAQGWPGAGHMARPGHQHSPQGLSRDGVLPPAQLRHSWVRPSSALLPTALTPSLPQTPRTSGPGARHVLSMRSGGQMHDRPVLSSAGVEGPWVPRGLMRRESLPEVQEAGLTPWGTHVPRGGQSVRLEGQSLHPEPCTLPSTLSARGLF